MENEKDGIPAVYAKNRHVWRAWLEKNHSTEKKAWLIIYKKESATPSVYYPEAVEEALCFGWIDSKPNKRDGESYYLFFARRKPTSNWSKVNKQRVEKLVEQGLMTQAGMAMIELAKKTGTWEALEEVDNELVPDDLAAAFAHNKTAWKNFSAFPPSSKKIILEWVRSAKRPETRQKRIDEAVRLAAENIRANHYQR